MSRQVITRDGETVVTLGFAYKTNSDGTPTNQVGRVAVHSSIYDVSYGYLYDANGNIYRVSDGTNAITYVYDTQNQLLRENNPYIGKSFRYFYDDAGNITQRREYAYTTGTLENYTAIVNYDYSDPDWGDLLTSYNGQSITYDTIGNPLSDGTWTYTWEHGRQLASMASETVTWTYAYNADGLRTSRSNGTDTYTYVYNGSQLSQMTVGENTLRFAYDASGTPMTVEYDGTVYYYATNLQGDILAILDADGNAVVEYIYDAWGNIHSVSGSLAETLGALNPLRYRGYVYDNETELYYLQSRYYNPKIGRFINADGLIATGQSFIGHNMFAYCGNNPVTRLDTTGMHWTDLGRYYPKVSLPLSFSVTSFFGAGCTTTVTISETETSIMPDPSPFTIKTGTNITTTVSEYGDSSKPISVYADGSLDDPILSSSAGIKLNISKVTLDWSVGLDDIGATASFTSGQTTYSLGTRTNLSELKIGIEWSSAVSWDNTTETTYTNISVSGWFVAFLCLYATTGQAVYSPNTMPA